jgi:hypothetical protein
MPAAFEQRKDVMARQFFLCSPFVAVLLASSLTFAQSAAGPSGHWEGAIQVPGQELQVVIDLAQTDGKWEGTISIPAQGMKGFPLSDLKSKDGAVSFVMKGIPGHPQFTGKLSTDGKTLSGDFSQGGANMPFKLTRTGDAKVEPLPKSTPLTKELEGLWEGALNADGATLRLLFKLSNQPNDAGATGTLVSLDQGNAELPVGSIVQTGTKLTLLLPAILGAYEGELKDGQLVGTWTQGPRSLPLTLKRQ